MWLAGRFYRNSEPGYCHSVSILIAMHWSGPNLNGSIAVAQTREEISPRAALDSFLTKFDKVTERGFVKTL